MPGKEIPFIPLTTAAFSLQTNELSVEVLVDPIAGETRPRRNAKVGTGKLLSTPEEGVKTIFDLVTRSVQRFGNAPALGTRPVLRSHTDVRKVEDGKNSSEELAVPQKRWLTFERGPYSWMSFKDYGILVQHVGGGYRKLGMKKGDKVHVYAATSACWLAAAHGAASQSMSIVTAYEALGKNGLLHSLLETGAKAIFVDAHLLPTLLLALESRYLPDLKWIIYNDGDSLHDQDSIPEKLHNFNNVYPHFGVLSFEELHRLGKDNPVDPDPPEREDLCAIFYTSGSTGPPKGVPIKHKAAIASVAGLDSIIGDYLGEDDSFLAFLPLAHVLEFAFENASLFWGMRIGYASSKTLFNTSMHNCKGDLQELNPSFVIGAPAVWEAISKAIRNNFLKDEILVALYDGDMINTHGVSEEFLLKAKATALQTAREVVGSRLRFGMSGGGPIASSTQRFLSMVMAPLINGFGLTETMAMGGLTDPMELQIGSLGRIPSSIEMKLVDFPEAGYLTSQSPPQGEIWIRGDSVMEGYWQNKDETAKAITTDAWFKTGDIGQWEPNGQLKIVDRKKNLVKTLKGEYIALEKLESIYRSAAFVKNICIYASPTRSKPIAIIVPSLPALKSLVPGAADSSIQCVSSGAIASNEALQRLALQHLQMLGENAGLASFEVVEGLVMTDDEDWTPMNGMTTSVGKLNRKGILTKYHDGINRIYQGESV